MSDVNIEVVSEENKDFDIEIYYGFDEYGMLNGKPSINGVELNGNLLSSDLNLVSEAPNNNKVYARKNKSWVNVVTISDSTIQKIASLADMYLPSDNEDVTDRMKTEHIRQIKEILVSILES